MLQQVSIQRTFESWRDVARTLLQQGVEPGDILWNDDERTDLLLGDVPDILDEPTPGSAISIPRAFVDTARYVACYRDPSRWSLLYRIAWRITHGEHRLLDISVDDDVRRFEEMQKAVRRDRHKMTAFVRFRKVDGPEENYVAWHRPDHFIVRLTTPFFTNRFAAMRWTILTPDDSVTWDGHEAKFGPGVPASQAPQGDELEELWRTYYANIFNPARVKIRAMKREMPVRHWNTLPETAMIPELLREAPARVEAMVARQRRMSERDKAAGRSVPADAGCPTATSAAEFVPASRSLTVLAKAATECKGCGIYCNATQVVFGEGPRNAKLMFIGEQPGDQEDRAGKPFVGPAGQLLDDFMQRAGIPREQAYVTNAVKHFKFEPRGTRRIHAKPSAREVGACRPWLEAEIDAVKPEMIVCLGATAAQSLLGSGFRVTRQRGKAITDTKWAPWVMATVHPSALLRVPDESMRDETYAAFLADLKTVARQWHVIDARSRR